MRHSNFAAAAFAVLIAAVLAFVAGYYVGGQSVPTPPVPQPVALADPLEQPAEQQGSGPLEAEKKQPTPEPPPKVVAGDTSQPKTDTDSQSAPAPGTETKPSSGMSADELDDLYKLSELLKKAEKADPELIITGPKVPCTVTVSGVVLDSTGAPVAGASVLASKGEVHDTSSGGRRITMAFTSGNSSGTSIATTDGAGAFMATVSLDVSEGSSMRLTLTAEANGYARSKPNTVTLKNGDTRDGIELRLRGAGSVVGRVVDGNGVGVAGVSVALRESEQAEGTGSFRMFGFGGGPGPHSAVTDTGGEFFIEGVPEGQYSYELFGAGFKQLSGPTAQTVQADTRNAAPAEFVVQRVTSLVALLENDKGALTGGLARVELIDASGKLERMMPGRVLHDGMLELNEPPTGSFQVKISVNGYAPYTGQVNIFDGQRADMGTIRLERAEGQTPSRVILPD